MNSVLVIGMFLGLIFITCLMVGMGVISPILFLINYNDRWFAIIVLISGIIGTIIVVGVWIAVLS